MAVPYHGITFEVNGTPYANIRATELPNPEWDDDEITTAASEDNAREFMAGLVDGGEPSVTLMYAPSQSSAIYALGGVDATFAFNYSNGKGWEFDGYIKAFGDEGDLGSHFETTVSMKVSGKPRLITS